MSILLQIQGDYLEARRAEVRDELKIKLLSTFCGEIETASKKPGAKAGDDLIVPMLRKFISNAADTVAALKEGDVRRTGAQREIEILTAYMPAAPSDDAVRSFIVEEVDWNPNIKQGDLMKKLKEKFGAVLDQGHASSIVREELAKAK